MAVFNLGSVNLDLVYRVAHVTEPGETQMSTGLSQGLGGKGANMSVALAEAGARPRHFGAVGPDGAWAVAALAARGVDCSGIRTLETPTGQAIIQVADDGENAITLLPGANWDVDATIVDDILRDAREGDWILLQNETAHVPLAAERAKTAGLRVAYAAAPFDAAATSLVLPHIDLLALNEIEAGQMEDRLGQPLADLGIDMVLVTLGAQGANLLRTDAPSVHQPATKVAHVVDTTGAGDTFLGFFLGRIVDGDDIETALAIASAAAALSVQKAGASAAIPPLEAVRSAMTQAT